MKEGLTDAGRLSASPGEIQQAHPCSGSLEYVSLLALEVHSAAHLDANRHKEAVNALMQMPIGLQHQIKRAREKKPAH